MICSVSSWDKVNFWAIIPPMSGSSSLSQLPRRSLVDCAIDAMREKIESRAWPVGERIPKEAELAEMLQVGRNTVREAIRVLSHADVLEVRQGDGTYVRFELDPAAVMRRVTRSSLRDHFELRVILETEAARLAAQHRTARDIRKLEKTLKARGEWAEGSDLDRFLKADTAFHLAVAEATHNEALIELYRYFLVAARQAGRAVMEEHGLPEPGYAAHERIFRAIEQGDGARAARAASAVVRPLVHAFSDHTGNSD